MADIHDKIEEKRYLIMKKDAEIEAYTRVIKHLEERIADLEETIKKLDSELELLDLGFKKI